jgi:transposase
MARTFTKPYPPEYRAEAVRLVREGGREITEVAKSLGVNDQSLRNWVKQADVDSGRRKDGLTTDERQELVRLRRRVRDLEEDKVILKKATAFFAAESRKTNRGLPFHGAREGEPRRTPNVPAAWRVVQRLLRLADPPGVLAQAGGRAPARPHRHHSHALAWQLRGTSNLGRAQIRPQGPLLGQKGVAADEAAGNQRYAPASLSQDHRARRRSARCPRSHEPRLHGNQAG